MEMPGSAPGVWKERWQYCPMRTRRLCELTFAVVGLHAIGWQLAAGGAASFAPARAGVHRFALVSVAQRTKVPAALAGSAVAPPLPEPVATSARDRPRPRGTSAPRASTGAGGALRRTPAEGTAWPVYATQPPPSTTLRYALVQGGRASVPDTGSAEFEWRRNAGTFSLRIATTVGERPPREWQSTGTFDAAGVAPLRLVERERGRDKRALSIDRDGGHVRFSGASGALAVAPGVQDRWSWVAQLAAIAEAGARRGQVPVRWDLQVAGLRGELERWTFRVLPPGDPPPELSLRGNELSARDDRAPALLHVVRAAERPYDLRVEAWLSPVLHHLPAGLRMSNPPGNWSLSLWQRSS
jgi:hypothetical protein